MSRYLGIDETKTGLRRSARGRWRIMTLVLAAASLVAIVLTIAACGGTESGGEGGSTSSTGPDGSIAHPTGANEVVIQVTVGGGFVPVEYNLTLVPQFSLYGDGTVIIAGPVPAIYPGPALPNLQTTVISEEATQAILSAAKENGLFDPTVDYGQPGITDMATTTIVINADGTTYRSDIYALGMESGAGGLTLEQQQARAAVSDLVGKLTVLEAFETGELVWKPYEYAALAVYSQPVDPAVTTDATDIQPNELEWPLGDLSTLGEPVQPEGYRQVVISGADLATLQPLLPEATMITVWTSGDQKYHLYFRPLLPEETALAGSAAA
jgi:hypothetical protein